MKFLLAHGALGAFDEIFLFAVVGILVVMFVAPSLGAFFGKSQADSAPPEEETAPPTEPEAASNDKTHFKLK
jgi:hypothetical protein